MSTRLYTSYYLLTLSSVVGVIIWTVATSSALVGYGSQLSQLQAKKAQLLDQRDTLNRQIAQSTSLASTNDFVTAQGFEPVQKPLVVKSDTMIALR